MSFAGARAAAHRLLMRPITSPVATASIAAVVAALGATSATAAAQEGPARVNVRLEGSSGVLLEERLPGTAWRLVCKSPCNGVVTSAPHAKHRLVDGWRRRDVVIEGRAGESRLVQYTRPPAASAPLVVVGIALGAGGIGLGVAGIARVLEGMSVDIYGCNADAACEAKDERSRKHGEQGWVLVGVAAALVVVGGVAVAVGAVNGSASTSVSARSADAPRATSKPRAAAWAQAEPPPPPNHTTLFEVRF